ncbi:MAG: hypothetical protein FJX76_04155 [Armatimonadetes bacterium]|nr:hypothetical protein [Armatimonadota bacterium]
MGARAGLLSQDPIIKTLNEHYVSVFVRKYGHDDVDWIGSDRRAQVEDWKHNGLKVNPPPLSTDAGVFRQPWTTTEAELRLYKTLKLKELAYLVEHPEAPGEALVGPVHASILSPDGEVMDVINLPFRGDEPKFVYAQLLRAVEELGTPPGPPVRTLLAGPKEPLRPGDLALRVDVRFIADPVALDDVIAHLDGTAPANTITLRMEAPVREWIVLREDEWRALLTPGRAPQAVAEKLLGRFVPPTDQLVMDEDYFETMQMETRAYARSAETTTVQLHASARIKHSWGRNRDYKVAEFQALGYLEVDHASGAVNSFRMATMEGRYGTPGHQIPFGVAVQKDAGEQVISVR